MLLNIVAVITGIAVYFIIRKIISMLGNHIETKVESVLISAEEYNEDDYYESRWIITIMYKGKQKRIQNKSRKGVGEKIKVNMKCWYKNGKLRKFEIMN